MERWKPKERASKSIMKRWSCLVKQPRSREAVTLSNMASYMDPLGETQKALDKYNEALPVFQTVGDRRGEAQTLAISA